MATTTFSVSVLLHQDGDAWVAQCLEYDVAAQGATADDAKRRFLRTLSRQILFDLADGCVPLAGLGPAPEQYFDRMVGTVEAGPELPVYVPAGEPKAKVRFVQESSQPHA